MSGVRVQGRTIKDQRLTERWNVTRGARRLRPSNAPHANAKLGPMTSHARHRLPADANIRHSSPLSLQVADATRWFSLRRTGILEGPPANSEPGAGSSPSSSDRSRRSFPCGHL